MTVDTAARWPRELAADDFARWAEEAADIISFLGHARASRR